jgi:hypothetical protein
VDGVLQAQGPTKPCDSQRTWTARWATTGDAPKGRHAGWHDQIRKCDIDFDGMRAQAEAEAISEHAKVTAALAGLPKPMAWGHVREDMFPGDIDGARHFYNGQPGIKALRDSDIWPTTRSRPTSWTARTRPARTSPSAS